MTHTPPDRQVGRREKTSKIAGKGGGSVPSGRRQPYGFEGDGGVWSPRSRSAFGGPPDVVGPRCLVTR